MNLLMTCEGLEILRKWVLRCKPLHRPIPRFACSQALESLESCRCISRPRFLIQVFQRNLSSVKQAPLCNIGNILLNSTKVSILPRQSLFARGEDAHSESGESVWSPGNSLMLNLEGLWGHFQKSRGERRT